MRIDEEGNEAISVSLAQSYAQRMEYIGIYAWEVDMDCISLKLDTSSIEGKHWHQYAMKSKEWLNRAGLGSSLERYFSNLLIILLNEVLAQKLEDVTECRLMLTASCNDQKT